MNRLAAALHNIIIHPICGVLWLVGATRLGNWLHDFGGFRGHHYIHWPRERLCWFKDQPASLRALATLEEKGG